MNRHRQHRLSVDPIACTAHGLCAELLPERIELDEWGYPIIDDRGIGDPLVREARAAVAACPTLALRLTDESGRRRPARVERP